MALATPTDSASPSPSISIISDLSYIKAQNRGPITSLFTPPASCTDTLTTIQPAGDASWLFFGHVNDPYFDASCIPQGTLTPRDLVNGDRWESYYYSPAICPQGWETVTTFQSTVPGGDLQVFVRIGAETTAALCCPSGYTYHEKGHLCASVATRDQRVGYVSPTNLGNSWDRGSVSTSTMASEITVLGDGVPIWWQSSDEAVLAAATAAALTEFSSSPTRQTLASTSSSIRDLSSSTSEPASHNGSGLPGSAKTGIGVGIAAFALIVGIIAILFVRRHKKRKSPVLPELGGPDPVEKYANGGRHELPVPAEPAELHASPTQMATNAPVAMGS